MNNLNRCAVRFLTEIPVLLRYLAVFLSPSTHFAVTCWSGHGCLLTDTFPFIIFPVILIFDPKHWWLLTASHYSAIYNLLLRHAQTGRLSPHPTILLNTPLCLYRYKLWPVNTVVVKRISWHVSRCIKRNKPTIMHCYICSVWQNSTQQPCVRCVHVPVKGQLPLSPHVSLAGWPSICSHETTRVTAESFFKLSTHTYWLCDAPPV